jgi:hypothetical protein
MAATASVAIQQLALAHHMLLTSLVITLHRSDRLSREDVDAFLNDASALLASQPDPNVIATQLIEEFSTRMRLHLAPGFPTPRPGSS